MGIEINVETINRIDRLTQDDHPPETIAFIDIDETVVADIFFDLYSIKDSDLYQKLVAERFSTETASDEHYSCALRSIASGKQTSERITSTTIHTLAERVHHLFFLTARMPSASDKTYDLLKEFKLIPKRTFSKGKRERKLYFYDRHILYTGANNKGDAARRFLKRYKLKWNRLIFVDNRIIQINRFAQAFSKHRDKLRLYHYTRIDYHYRRPPFIEEALKVQSVLVARHNCFLDPYTMRYFLFCLYNENRLSELENLDRIKSLVDELIPHNQYTFQPQNKNTGDIPKMTEDAATLFKKASPQNGGHS